MLKLHNLKDKSSINFWKTAEAIGTLTIPLLHFLIQNKKEKRYF